MNIINFTNKTTRISSYFKLKMCSKKTMRKLHKYLFNDEIYYGRRIHDLEFFQISREEEEKEEKCVIS